MLWQRRRFAAAFLVLLLFALVLGWMLWPFRPPVAGPLRLTKVSFAMLPDWHTGDPSPALEAFRRSCAIFADEKAATAMGGAGYAGTVSDWLAACRAAATAKDARAYFEQWFVPVRIGAGALGDGLFTGYYEPELLASRVRHGAFRYPVYALPDDLVSVDLGLFRPSLRGQRIAGKVEDGKLLPYATRAEIDARGLEKAHILFYASDPVALFFLHIQGSGRVRFEDGRLDRVAYAGQNGQVYTPIGRTLVAEGALTKEQLSLQSIATWLHAHPGKARAIMESDASYVFFKDLPLGDPRLGAKGAEGVALTPGSSLAVDMTQHALGVPFYVATAAPDAKPLRFLAVAQDTGGAIRGPVRADIFFGFGKRAETLAGGMNHAGELYVLLPKPIAARLRPQTDYPGPP
jgi:membrane-bound lytic murein transglycosylase A